MHGCIPEQFTAVGVILVIDRLLEYTTEVKRQPAQGKYQHQAEHCLGHFPPLENHKHTKTMLVVSAPCDHTRQRVMGSSVRGRLVAVLSQNICKIKKTKVK